MAITIDVKIGDTILVGKFKNKKMVIKDIGAVSYTHLRAHET